MDVSAFYTNIPHDERDRSLQESVKHARSPRPCHTGCYKFNNVNIDEEHYLQIKGTAMGTRMAPSSANIFMDDHERNILANAEKTPSI